MIGGVVGLGERWRIAGETLKGWWEDILDDIEG
jgi:hypothetical protein